jgi:hypothetical protein
LRTAAGLLIRSALMHLDVTRSSRDASPHGSFVAGDPSVGARGTRRQRIYLGISTLARPAAIAVATLKQSRAGPRDRRLRWRLVSTWRLASHSVGGDVSGSC